MCSETHFANVQLTHFVCTFVCANVQLAWLLQSDGALPAESRYFECVAMWEYLLFNRALLQKRPVIWGAYQSKPSHTTKGWCPTGGVRILHVMCNVLQCFAVSALQCVAMCCSECVAMCCNVLQWVRCNVLQCVAVSALQCVAMCCNEFLAMFSLLQKPKSHCTKFKNHQYTLEMAFTCNHIQKPKSHYTKFKNHQYI